MADDPQKRLERQANYPVPPLDPDFANRLESKLRVDHATATTRRPWAARSTVPRVFAAAALVVAGVAGIVAVTADDAGVPVAVVNDEQPAALDAPLLDGDTPTNVIPTPTATSEQTQGFDAVAPQPSPTATPVVGAPPSVPTVDPTDPPATPTSPTSRALPTQSTVPAPSATPRTTTPQTTATPTAATQALPATTVPVPTQTTRPEVTATPMPPIRATPEPRPTTTQPTPTVTPTPEREPAPIELVCASRTSNDAVGVICSWDEPTTDRTVERYQVMRSRNSGDAQVVARRRAEAPRSYIDRNVDSGDEVIYLVQALDAEDGIVGVSVREIVRVP